VSKIDDLIKQLCPNGVEAGSLGDLGIIFGGLSGKSRADFSGGNARFVSYVNVFNNIAIDLRANDFVRVEPGERQRALARGDIILTGSSETPDEVGMSSVVTGEIDQPLYLNSFCIGFRLNDPDLLEPDFAKHLFRSAGIRQQIVRTANGVTRFNVSKARLAKIIIPLPPIEVQREIVRILDNFIELDDSLERELDARQRQYGYYRDELLSFRSDPGVQWMPMSEVGTFTRGRRITKADVVPEGLASIHYGEIYTGYGVSADQPLSRVRPEMASSLRFAKTGDVVIAGVGETVEDVAKAVAWLGAEDIAFHDDCWAFRSSLNPKFVSYYLQTRRFHAEKKKYVARAKVKRISGTGLGKIGIPVPDRAAQDRIVAILDKFDVLANDRSIGLPAEITLRRAQYEHYRDHLMTFSEAAQ
jgi:type I restriction enzyme S subunit